MEKVNSAKCTAGPFSHFARNENEERELLNENSSNMRAKKRTPFDDETQLFSLTNLFSQEYRMNGMGISVELG